MASKSPIQGRKAKSTARSKSSSHSPAKAPKSKSAGPKSLKADGTAKKRWSAAERAERGHGPRRSGGQSRSTRDDRGTRGPERGDRFERSERSDRFDRNDRPQRSDRFDRSDRPQRNDRNDRFDRNDRPQRNDRFDRNDRPQRNERFDRNDRPQRNDRSDRFDRSDRPQRNDRSDRFDRGDRPQRNDRFDRSGRPQRNDRSDRFERSDRPQRSDRNDRNERFDRNDRPQRSDRNDRFDRGDRGHSSSRRPRSSDAPFPRERRRDDLELDVDQMDWAPSEVELSDAAPSEGNGFAGLGLPDRLVAALESQGITEPFPIQAATIPDALGGRDVLGRGQTGSGKTLGFGLPMLTRLADGRRGTTRAVVLVPTRELALQVADVLSPLAGTVGLSVVLVAGGMSYGPQTKAFDRGVDVVVATPGRLIDLMDSGVADLSQVEVTVLDEADHMADLGFLPDVRRVLDAVPAEGQRLLFSATLDRGVDTVVREYLSDPVTHQVDSDRASVATMTHHVFQVRPADKAPITAEIANRKGRTVVFARTQRGADRIAGQLREAGVMAGALHGGLTQGARARMLAAFKAGTVPVLVATDVAARGIHVDDVSLVLQVDPPAGPKDYLHRAGRTARAGGEGAVVLLALPHQKRDTARLLRQAGVAGEAVEAGLDDEHVYRTTGARKPVADPISDADLDALIAPPRKTRRASRGPAPRRPRYRRDRD